VELWAGKKEIGQLQAADYGVVPETTDIQLQARSDGRSIEDNHITFLLEGVEKASELEVRLVDARTEQVLDKMEHVEVAISL
jgi:curli biogenesis system outer membrane secretion channel CsgG